MTQKQTPSDTIVRQAKDADWHEVVECWYGYEKGTPENLSFVNGLLNTSSAYTSWGLWKQQHLQAVCWVSNGAIQYAHVLPVRSIYRFDTPLHQKTIVELWQYVTEYYFDQGVLYFQALISKELSHETESLQVLGFAPLANIVRMRLLKDTNFTASPEEDVTLDVGCDRSLFIQVLKHCFWDSLDVPELNVLNSQQALVQQYDGPSVICVTIERIGEPIGVIAIETDGENVVLKYIGLVPEARGEGYASKALAMLIAKLFHTNSHLLRGLSPLGSLKSINTIELRVDARNAPAIRLYKNAGFTEFDTETMLLYPPITSPGLR